ncbi:MAG: hypothetical protein KDC92_16730 [Bacteroidetes bacterium]|nr:hypothetical protein [Bacteroidota bacterium]
MIRKTKPITEVKLWKDNKISGEYTMPVSEFKTQFFEWLRKQDKDWCNHYGSRTAVCEFIGKELKSVADFDPKKGIDDYTELSKQVQDEFWNIVEKELV